MRTLAVVSLHTSPLTLPGSGDSGGMNVYVRELVGSLAQAGVQSEVYVRRWRDDLPDVVEVEPGFKVVHIDSGPPDLAKEDLPGTVEEFTEGVARRIEQRGDVGAIHANYWLSGLVGHSLKHRFDLPLVSTFHTLARVKADQGVGDAEPQRRELAEGEVIGCSDAILASCQAEFDDLVAHYDARPDRIEIVPPGVHHAFFSPGDRRGARAALGLGDQPVLLFVGRIQRLKGLTVAVATLAEISQHHPDAVLLVVGGPSGTDGDDELAASQKLAAELGVTERIRFVAPQPHHLLSVYYRAADVCIVPSRSESFGLVALEAAACGTPVVAAAVGGLATLVQEGRTGFLIDERSPSHYAEAVERILGSPALAGSLSTAAVELARGFTWSTTAARLRRLYADLTARTLVQCP